MRLFSATLLFFELLFHLISHYFYLPLQQKYLLQKLLGFCYDGDMLTTGN